MTDAEFDRAIAETDVCLCLRWPTNREASGPWLRALAAGKPTVVNDLAHLVDVPTLDPRTWQVLAAPRDAADALAAAAARRRSRSASTSWTRITRSPSRCAGWRSTPALRASLGASRAARAGPPSTRCEAMTDDYEARDRGRRRASRARPGRRAGCRAHLPPTAPRSARRLSAEVGVTVDFSADDDSPERRPARARRAAHRDARSSPQLDIDARRVAVEHNLIVVKRAAYDSTIVAEGDEVEIVNFVGGDG